MIALRGQYVGVDWRSAFGPLTARYAPRSDVDDLDGRERGFLTLAGRDVDGWFEGLDASPRP